MLNLNVLTLIALLTLFLTPTQQKDCQIVDLWQYDGGFMMLSANTYTPIYPSPYNAKNDRNITIASGQTVILSCANGRFYSTGGYVDTKTRTLLTTCNSAGRWETHDTYIEPNLVRCYTDQHIQVRSMAGENCGYGTQIIKVGLPIGLNLKYVKLLDICFDRSTRIAKYVSQNLTASTGSIKSYLTTRTKYDSIYYLLPDLNFTAIYEDIDYQKQVVNELLGLDVNSEKYIKYSSCKPNPGVSTPGFCFTERKLAYKGFFVYVPQQFATFRYLNIVPQWSFIDYNLDKIERNIFDYTTLIKQDLNVFSGTYGVATLPHEVTKQPIELYLYNTNGVKSIPLPLIFWKFVYNPDTFKGVVLITINNPWQVEVPVTICADVSEQVGWLTWDRMNITKGYSYACEYDDFKQIVDYLPYFYVDGLLI